VPGNSGSFLRVVDAVKGPFYPAPPPFPTFLLQEGEEGFPTAPLLAPVADSDFLLALSKEPDDPY
jgi:hypothetical protein